MCCRQFAQGGRGEDPADVPAGWLIRPSETAGQGGLAAYFVEPAVAPAAGYFFRISASEWSRCFLSALSLAS
jgi:hypothetical protein